MVATPPSVSPIVAAGSALSGTVISSPSLPEPFIVGAPALSRFPAASAPLDGPRPSAISAAPIPIVLSAPVVLNEQQAFERIAAAVHLNLEQLERNISQARSSSGQFFRLTLVSAGVGFLVVIAGVFLLLSGQVTAGVVSSISSIIPEATAVIFFRKDGELRAALEGYNQHILESQRILTMVDLTETVRDPAERDRLKRDLIFRVLER